jgi:hypothetical protein
MVNIQFYFRNQRTAKVKKVSGLFTPVSKYSGYRDWIGLRISDCGLRISDFGFKLSAILSLNLTSDFRLLTSGIA